MNVDERLKQLGLTLSVPRRPAGNYRPATLWGGLVFTSGQGSASDEDDAVLGRLGDGLNVRDGYRAARLCALNCLAAIRSVTNSLDVVEGILQVRGFVAAVPEFSDHPAVLDGASDLFVEIFGEAGRHVRTTVGVASLPKGYAVEVDVIARLRT